MSETFNTNVEINGSSDTTQLKVSAHSSQTAPLQSWNTSSGDQVARTESDGRFQTGSLDTGAGATGDAQIEVFRHEDAKTLPTRGLNITGAIKDALTSVVSWSVHELFLKGSAGVRALHSALRVRIVNQNTGTTNTNAEIRAGEFEILNSGGASGNPIPVATGIDVRVTNEATGYVGTAYGMRVLVDDLNTNGISDSYALHATGGKTRLDDVLELHSQRTSAPLAESQVAKIYVKDDGKLYARLESGMEYLLSSAHVPVSPGDGKVLTSDGTWQTAGNGTVTSIGLSTTNVPELIVDDSPVTGSGTISLAKATQQPNQVFAGPTSGSAAVPTFRALVSTDITAVNAAAITTGTLPDARLSSQVVQLAETQTLTNKTLTTPTISSFVSANHTHLDAAGGGQLNASSIFNSGQVPVARGGTGVATANANSFFAGPVSGGTSAPNFRSLTNADIYTLDPRLVAGPLNTMDDVVTTLFATNALSAGSAVMIDGYVMARRGATVSQGLVSRFAATFARGASSDIAVVGLFLNTDHNSNNAPTVIIDVHTASQVGRVRVQGVAGQGYNWKAVYTITAL